MPDRRPATAFVPGHITGLFTVHRTDDPETSGSRGAGVTLSKGVTVSVDPHGEPTVTVDGSERSVESIDRVLTALDVDPAVDVETELPLGRGFGLSGGMALGTALASNEAFGLARSENELIRIAHTAEVAAGTGLGDVVAQARGGLPIRLEPGPPPHGSMDGIPSTGRVEFLAYGDLSTPAVLKERPREITNAGESALEFLLDEPTRDRFMEASRRFAGEVGLLTPQIESVIEDVEERGGRATMAMLGQTVFALGTDLSDAGYQPEVTTVHSAGASLRE